MVAGFRLKVEGRWGSKFGFVPSILGSLRVFLGLMALNGSKSGFIWVRFGFGLALFFKETQ